MKVPTLSETERLILINQYEILSALQPSEKRHRQCIEALQSGYEGLYGRLMFEFISKPIPASVSDEVQDIFDMYRALDAAYKRGIAKPEGAHPQFDGFDGNNDQHHTLGVFLVETMGLWGELKSRPMNSHSQAELPAYLRMLEVYRSLGKPYPLSEDHVRQIVEAG